MLRGVARRSPRPLTVACATCSVRCMMSDEQAASEKELADFRATLEGRDDMVRRARAAGLSKNRIHVLSGIARTTIDRIINGES
ncbi:DUF6003 family protein [Streptomyces resistomycificus]|uniref:DUF6003 family protein n=1 Tax=Streptomyces resistomycificus TaxID=67356 RepID=UPI001CED524B|nr:DUF6003 family protein [Streptomyces resistomycificus]